MERSNQEQPATPQRGPVRHGTTQKFTPPQKRRKRLQRSAIRHAVVNTNKLKDMINFPRGPEVCATSDWVASDSLTGRLDVMLTMLQQVHNTLTSWCVMDSYGNKFLQNNVPEQHHPCTGQNVRETCNSAFLDAYPTWNDWEAWHAMDCDTGIDHGTCQVSDAHQQGNLSNPCAFNKQDKHSLLAYRTLLPDNAPPDAASIIFSVETTTLTLNSNEAATVAACSTSDGETTQEEFCNWRPMPKEKFAIEGTPEYVEIRIEAATRLQCFFRQRACIADEDVTAEVLDATLTAVWLPLPEWRLATGMLSMEPQTLQSVYGGEHQGQRDFDTKVWLKMQMQPDAEAEEAWEPSAIKAWYQRLLAISEAGVHKDGFAIQRVREILLEWSHVRFRIPLVARQVVAEGVFSQVATLRKVAYSSDSISKIP